MNDQRKQTAQQWSTFWERGSITTFMGRFENNYDSDLLAFWLLELDQIAEDSRIIDLATGNGALALIAARYSAENNKNFEITAVDYAEIRPGLGVSNKDHKLLKQIHFLGNTNIEDTGLEAASFDVAISQFGFEYGDANRSVAEMARLLRPRDSKAILMVHHETSAILTQTRETLAQIELCKAPEFHQDIISLQRRLAELRHAKADPATDAEAERLRDSLNHQTERLHDAQENFNDPSQLAFYLETSMSVFNPKLAGNKTVKEKSDLLAELRQQIADYKARMEDLMIAASSEKDIEGYTQSLTDLGFEISRSEAFLFERTSFAHIIIASR
jgi:SAM-dependent methyltransferase